MRQTSFRIAPSLYFHRCFTDATFSLWSHFSIASAWTTFLINALFQYDYIVFCFACQYEWNRIIYIRGTQLPFNKSHPLYKTKKYAACRKYGFYYLNASLCFHIWQAKWLILLASFKGCPYLYMNTLLQILLYMNIAYFLYAVYTSTR